MNRVREALSAPISVGRLRLAVIVAAVPAAILKLFVASRTLGTDDVWLFRVFAGVIRDHGPIGIYGAPPRVVAPYNHPPLTSYLLALFNFLSDHGVRFETLVRMPATLADLVAAVVLFELIRTRRPVKEAALGGILFAWSPALGIISGYHGNNDPACVMFAILAIYLLMVRDAPALAGISFALGLSIKLPPIVAGPVLLLVAWRASRLHVVKLLAGGAAVMVALWGPAFVLEWEGMRKNVIGYAGYGPKQWGISQFIEWMGLPDGLIDLYAGPGRFLVLAICAGVPVLVAWRWPERTLPAFGLTFALFLLITPVHAMQYTVWPIAGLYLMNIWGATAYSFAGGLLLAKVYSRWSHAYPWNWKQAWSDGMAPFERRYAGLVWLVLLAAIVVGLVPRWNRFVVDSPLAAHLRLRIPGGLGDAGVRVPGETQRAVDPDASPPGDTDQAPANDARPGMAEHEMAGNAPPADSPRG